MKFLHRRLFYPRPSAKLIFVNANEGEMLRNPGIKENVHSVDRPRAGGVLGISSDGDDRMEPKVKTKKNLWGFQQNPKKSLDQKLTPPQNPMFQ